MNLRWLALALTVAALGLPACTVILPGSEPPAPEEAGPTPLPLIAPGGAYQDARGVFDGVCFEYWEQQINRVFALSGAFDHIRFYNEVDESGLCRFAVTRNPFDFTEHILVGAVNVGTGCWATTNLRDVVTDDAAQTITVRVTWSVEGECNYRLARPFWISLPRPPEGYTVQMAFEAGE